jgi:hypothetical protein
MRIVPTEERGECAECEAPSELKIEFEGAEEEVLMCRDCLDVLKWHVEHLDAQD